MAIYQGGKKVGAIVPIKDELLYKVVDDTVTTISSKDIAGATKIRKYMFAYMDNVEHIEIPDTVTTINELNFCYCPKLKSITIPENITSIGYFVGSSNDSLTDIYYNAKNAQLIYGSGGYNSGYRFCSDNNLHPTAHIGKSVEVLPSGLFSTNIAPASVSKIIFDDNVKITTLPKQFCESNYLESINIPSSITKSYWVNSEISSLKSVYITDLTAFLNIYISITDYGYIYGLFGKGADLYINGEKVVNLQIPDEITTIKPYILGNCGSIETVNIPDSVTGISRKAFARCSNLKTITIPSSVTYIVQSFRECSNLTDVKLSEGLLSINGAFYGCTNLKNINLPNTLREIKSDYNGYSRKYYPCFYNCTSLTGMTIPSSVATIDRQAFEGCTSLVQVIMEGETPPTAGTTIFNKCTNLAEILVPNETAVTAYKAATNWSTYKDKIFCNNISSLVFTAITSSDATTDAGSSTHTAYMVGNGTTTSGNGVASGATITTLHAPAYYNGLPVTVVGQFAFRNKTIITDATFGSELTTIGNHAFNGCTNLATVTFATGSKLTTIGVAAFANCTGLTSITIPDSVTSIGNNAFTRCTSLTSITIGSGVTSISVNAFSSCTKLATVTFTGGDNLTTIGANAFINCAGLTSITIPDSVTSIGSSAFANCTGLTSITIGSGVTSIGFNAFNGCSSLTEMTVLATTPPTLQSTISSATTTIYIPKGTLSAYQTATNWSSFASKFVELSE